MSAYGSQSYTSAPYQPVPTNAYADLSDTYDVSVDPNPPPSAGYHSVADALSSYHSGSSAIYDSSSTYTSSIPIVYVEDPSPDSYDSSYTATSYGDGYDSGYASSSSYSSGESYDQAYGPMTPCKEKKLLALMKAKV
jgi:hypothetical protein